MGILIILGVIKRNVDVAALWSPTSIHYQEYVTLTMSREEFKTICRCITFDDVDTCTEEDSKFHKMQYIFSQFENNIRNAFEPHSHTCVDETLYAF